MAWLIIDEFFGRRSIVDAFSHLKTLALAISGESDDIPPELIDIVSSQIVLGRAFQSATGLQILSLRFIRSELEDPRGRSKTATRAHFEHTFWSRIIGNFTWPFLRELTVISMDMELSFVEFVRQHPKFDPITIHNPYLLAEHWFQTFHRMKLSFRKNGLKVF